MVFKSFGRGAGGKGEVTGSADMSTVVGGGEDLITSTTIEKVWPLTVTVSKMTTVHSRQRYGELPANNTLTKLALDCNG